MAITKTAYLFRSFSVSLSNKSRRNPKFNFNASAPLALKCKCDNFASSVTIFVPDSVTDNIFEFKYLTFDKSAIFEITDCIRNDNYYTLFIDFISNIEFDTPLTDFSLSRITPTQFNGTGFSFRDFVACLNTNKSLMGYANIFNPDFMYALRVELSEIPQNLKNSIKANKQPETSLDIGKVSNVENLIFRPLTKSQNSQTLSDGLFNEPQNNITAIIPLPVFDDGLPINSTKQKTIFQINLPNGKYSIALTWQKLIKLLNKLISDLSLKITIIPFAEKTVNYDYITATSKTKKSLAFSNPAQCQRLITLDASDETDPLYPTQGLNVAVKSGAIRWYADIIYPVILTIGGTKEGAPLIPFVAKNDITKPFVSQIKIFNQLIDVSDSDLSDLYIQNFSSFLRVYTDFDKNEYVDVPNTFEFSKSAYSNYEAYTAANINLSEKQKSAALDMQQKQQRETTYAQMGINLAASGVQAAIGVATGNPVSAASAASTAFGAVSQVVSTEMGIANAKANFKLEMEQMRERETQTIKTGNILSGSITINDFIFQKYTLCAIFAYYYDYNSLSNIEKERIYKYMIKNNIMSTIYSSYTVGTPYIPNIIPEGYPYQMKFITNGNTTNKDFIVMGKIVG